MRCAGPRVVCGCRWPQPIAGLVGARAPAVLLGAFGSPLVRFRDMHEYKERGVALGNEDLATAIGPICLNAWWRPPAGRQPIRMRWKREGASSVERGADGADNTTRV